MSKKYLTAINLSQNELQNAKVQNLASDPSSPTLGQVYFNTGSGKLRTYNGSTWDEMGTSTAAGDVSSNTATSVDSEVVLFNGTTGKSVKRATGSGIAKLTSGVLGTATAGTDYVAATSGSSVQKANGAGGLTAATSGTDYSAGTSALATGIVKSTTTTGALTIAVAGDFPTLNQSTTGSAATLTTPRAIYGNNFDGSAAVTSVIASTYGGTGNGFAKLSGPATSEKTFTLPNASATILTDNAAVTVAQGGTGAATLTGLVKGNGTSAFTAASAGTDYQAAITATGILKGAGSGSVSAAVSGTDYAPATATTSALKGNGSGGFTAATLNDVGAATADYSLNSHKLTNVLDPSSAQDAATKNYVDLTVQGISWKNSVRAATSAAGTLATSFANGSVIDGVTLATGDRILIKNQATASENGIYVVAASGAPTRATDADTGAEVYQAAVFAREGTTNADSAWVLTNDTTPTLGTTGLTFVQFSQSGGVQSATTSVSGISRYATVAEAQGKSISTASVTPAGLTDFTRKFTATVGNGSSTSLTVTHNLGTKDVITQVRQVSDDAVVECDIVNTSTTVVTLSFAVAPATNSLTAVVQG